MERIDALVFQHDKDLYRGNGKPGLTTRMQQAEDKMENIDTCIEDQSLRIDKIDKKFWAIILLLLTLLGGVIADIVEKTQTQGHSSLITTDEFTASK